MYSNVCVCDRALYYVTVGEIKKKNTYYAYVMCVIVNVLYLLLLLLLLYCYVLFITVYVSFVCHSA